MRENKERKEVEFITPQNKKECKFVGFDCKEGNSVFAFPCRYQIEEGQEKREARNIIHLIKKTQKNYLYGGANDELFQFHSMLWLIKDFVDRDYYVERERITKISTSGKINWKKTIKHNSVMYDSDTVVYKDFARYKSQINESQVLAQIYRCVLKYSVQRLGFIYGIEQVQGSIFTVERDSAFMLYFLQKELSQTFSDYKKTLIKHLVSIIKRTQGTTKGRGLSVSDEEFEYVFETVVNGVFGTEKPKSFYTHATYVTGAGLYHATKQRPDTVMKKPEGGYYIIDSKYYNYGYAEKEKRNPKELPESSSVIKQLAYNVYHAQGSAAEFRSIFLLPYAATNTSEPFEYIGYAYAKQDGSNLKNDEKVAICLVDLKTVVDTYLASNETKKAKLQESLIALVEKECFK